MIAFAQWLAGTHTSTRIQEILWIIPVVQCIHILAISTILGAALMINLRILEIAGQGQTMTSTSRRFLPWVWWGVGIAFLTGLVMIVGEPVRELVNYVFWAKMVMVLLSLALAAVFQTTLTRRVALWETSADGRRATRILAVLSMIAWVSIMVLGRLIAYNQISVD